MSFLTRLRRPDINAGVEQCGATPGAVLVDVRTAEEYAAGHVGSSVNVPLGNLEPIRSLAKAADTPLFVYCHSGARSAAAAAELEDMGYTHVHNIGGMMFWQGDLER